MEFDEFGKHYDVIVASLLVIKTNLETALGSIANELNHIDRFQCRIKDKESAYRKYRKKYGNSEHPFLEFEDLVAARFIVFFTSDIQIVCEKILDNFDRVERQEKRPEFDDQFGYESEHLVLALPPHLKPATKSEFYPKTFEVQIRTILMHAYAEPQHDILYKSSSQPTREFTRRMAWIAAACWGADREYEDLRRLSQENSGGRGRSNDSGEIT